jgi:hypothetical protein
MRTYRLVVIDPDGTEQKMHVYVNDPANALRAADALVLAVAGDYPDGTGFTFSRRSAETDLHNKKVLRVERPDGSAVVLTVEPDVRLSTF